ncbi:MAG: hypothetical protein JXR54_09990 [Tannerellaceae bacterium]|nr:hypothetical protein [Tannerellaceae bacterium]
MGKKWSKYKASDDASKWDKFKTVEANAIDIPKSSRIAFEHNNPGNLMYVGQDGAEKGEPKEGGGYWAKFESPEAGYMGLVKDIQAKQSGKTASNLSGDSTLKELISVYAPSTENDTQGYVKSIAERLGAKEDTPIKDIDADSIAENIAKIESNTKVGEEAFTYPNPEVELEEKNIEAKAYDAGLIPDLKPFTPETYTAKQSNIQQFVDNKNVLDADAYFTNKAVEEEAERQEKIAINAEKLGLSPEFLNHVIDINRAANPIPREKKQQEDYLLGSLGNFNEGLADIFRTLDRASTMMADAVGLEWKKPIFDTMSESLSRVGAEGAYKVPDNVVGNVMGGLSGMAPDIMMTYFMPEMKLTQMGKLTGGAITKIPKFPTWLGAKQGLQAYSQSGDSADRFHEFFSGAQHGFTEGLTYEALGLTGAEAGKLAKALGAGGLLTETTAGIANGTLFGVHGALMNPDFLQNGEIDSKQFFTDFGIGLAFHGKKIGEEMANLATVNQSMLRKAHTSFWTSNRDLIRTGFVSPKSQFELRRESQQLWDAAMKAESPAEKNQLLIAKTAVDNIISSRAYAIMVGSNPKAFKEAIAKDERLSDKKKDIMNSRIEETAEDFKTTIEEGKRGTNIAPEFEKFYETEKKSEKPEQKLSETEKKSAEETEKVPKTESEKHETEQVKKSEEAKSSQKKQPSAEASAQKMEASAEGGEQKIKEKEVKDAEGTRTKTEEAVREPAEGAEGQGGIRDTEKVRMEAEKGTEKKDVEQKIDKDGNGKRDDGRRNVPEEKVQEQQVQKPDAEKQAEAAVGKTKQGGKEKGKTGKKESESVPKPEKVEISDGKLKSKKDFMSDVSDEVSRKAIEGKSKRIVQDKQKAMDSEWKEAEKRKNKDMDKELDVEIFDETAQTTKNYRVRKKADGSLIISSYSEKDAKGRPKPLSRAEKDTGKLNQVRKKIFEEYKKKREAELKKERESIEQKYLEETDAEIKRTAEEYLAQREKETPKKTEEFQKEDSGEFPEKPTVMEGGKKQREKMPSEGKKVVIDEMAALKDEIKLWTKAAREQKQWTESEFKKVSSDIRKRLKESVDAKYIPASKYKSIITKLEEAVGGSEKKQKEAIDYVDKVLSDVEGTTERIDFMKRINGILNKKRTDTKLGQRKAKKNQPIMKDGEPVIGEDGKPIMRSTGVSPEAKLYLEEAQKHFRDAIVIDKKLRDLSKLWYVENPTKSQQDKMVTLQVELNELNSKLMDKIHELEMEVFSAKSDMKAERAQMALQAMKDMGDISQLNNEKLSEILDVLKKRETQGAEELNALVEKRMENINKITDIIDKGIKDFDVDSDKFLEQINRRRLFDAARQQAIKDAGIPKKIKWWIKDKKLSAKERKLKVVIDDLLSPNAHLESVIDFIDGSRNRVLVDYVRSEISNGTSRELRNADKGRASAFGKLLKVADKKLHDKLEKEFGKQDNVVEYIIENKKMTPKIQADINAALDNKIAEWGNTTTGEVIITSNGRKYKENYNILEALKFYAWSRNERLAKELERAGLTKEVIDNMLPKEAKEWADYVSDVYMDKTHNEINDIHKKTNYISLSKEEKYFPTEREKIYEELGTGKGFMSQDVSSNMYSFLIDRVQPKNPLRIRSTDNVPARDFVDLLNGYINSTSHYRAWAEASKNMDVLINHRGFQAASESVGLYRLVRNMIDTNINGAERVRNDYANSFVGRILSKYASVQLAAKVNMIPKQATSFINGIVEAERPADWMKELLKLAASRQKRKALMLDLYNNSPKIKERIDSYAAADPDLRGSGNGVGTKRDRKGRRASTSKTKKNLNKILNGYIPIGDLAGIMGGYGPVYMEALRKTGDKAKAIEEFEKYEGTQQSRSMLYLNSMQMKQNAINRMVLMFKSMPVLLLNKEMQALRGIRREFLRRDVKTGKRAGLKGIRGKDVTKFVVNHFLTNMLFTAVGYSPMLILGDKDDYMRKINRAALVGGLNGFFIAGDFFDWMVGRYYAGEKYDYSLARTPEDLWMKPWEKAMSAKEKKDLTGITEAAAMFALFTKGIPAHTLATVFEGFAEIGNGDVVTGFLRAMGYTDYVIDTAVEAGKKEENEDMLDVYDYELDSYSDEAEEKWGFKGKKSEENDNPYDY